VFVVAQCLLPDFGVLFWISVCNGIFHEKRWLLQGNPGAAKALSNWRADIKMV
jgi:hypothetical protein